MLHILLLILKIAGIILAVLLGLLLFAVLAVLFVPVRYRIEADGKMGEGEPFRLKLRVTWLFHIVNAAFSYPKAAYLRVRIFFFTILNTSGESKKPEKAGKRKKKTEPPADRESTSEDNIEEVNGQAENGTCQDKNEDAAWAPVFEKPESEKPADMDKHMDETDGLSEKGEEKGKGTEDGTGNRFRMIWDRLRLIFSKIWNSFINIRYTIKAICDRIKNIVADMQYYADVLQSDVFRSAFGLTRKQIGNIWKSIRPRKCDIHLLAGTGDPASTGQILAIYGILYPLIGNNVRIEADFGEQRVAEGSLFIKGRITLIRFLIVAVRIYRDKNIRRLIKMFKREAI